MVRKGLYNCETNLQWAVDVFPPLIDTKMSIDGMLDPHLETNFLILDFHNRVDVIHLCKGFNIGIHHHF